MKHNPRKALDESVKRDVDALMQIEFLQVGDVVTIEKASAINAAGATAVVIEVYKLAGRPGWTLLFADGAADGFSPGDCALFGVRKIGHEPTVAKYRFVSMSYLHADWRAGRFAAVFDTEARSIVEDDR